MSKLAMTAMPKGKAFLMLRVLRWQRYGAEKKWINNWIRNCASTLSKWQI
jgi:hypothetical protein